jgi:hypothetical protein
LGHAFNLFDPFRVVGDLIRNRSMWRGAVMTRASQMPPDLTNLAPFFTDLIVLRDIDRVWNVDSLFIRTGSPRGDWDPMIDEWSADEVILYDPAESCNMLRSGRPSSAQCVLSAWWD